jgi:hypothetical protein
MDRRLYHFKKCVESASYLLPLARKNQFYWMVPSGDLTLIVRTQKWGFSCKVRRRPPADIFLNKSLPPKNPLRTPCSWPPCPCFFVKNRWRLSKFRKIYETLTLTVSCKKMGLMSSRCLGWKLDLRATHPVLLHFWSDHLLEHSKALNKPQKTFKWPWKIKVSSTSSKFRLCASLKLCDLQIFGNAKKCLRGNLSTKIYFFVKMLNFVQSFVECKVSLADGMQNLREHQLSSVCLVVPFWLAVK